MSKWIEFISKRAKPNRISIPLVGLFLVATIVLAGTSLTESQPRKTTRDIVLVYSGLALGELKPCGCAKEEEQGGFERRMTYVKDLRSRFPDPVLIDLGDNFKEPTPQGKIKARYFLEALRQMQYDAVTLGDKDFVYGNDFVQTTGDIPWLSSNIRFKHGTAVSNFRLKTLKNGLKVGILAVADPKLFHLVGHSNIEMTAPRKAVEALLPKLELLNHPDLVVVLSHMQREDALHLLDIPGVNVVINGHIEKETDTLDMEPLRRDGKIFVQPGPKGQKMGELVVRLDSKGRPSFEQRMVRLDSSIKFDPEMVELYEKYNEEVEDLFLASLSAKRKQSKDKIYATDQACKTCHAEAHEIWSGSRHSQAYATLRGIDKAFDPECLACHTVGFDQPGGFISENDTAELENVQCEVCHGPALEHSKNPQPGFGKRARDACKLCHFGDHSPHFKFADYWPRIQH